jgi:hypothetical protein
MFSLIKARILFGLIKRVGTTLITISGDLLNHI